MPKQIVLSSSSRLALFIVEKALSVALEQEVVLRDCTITLHDPWASRFEDGGQIREAVVTGNLRPREADGKPQPVHGVVSIMCYADGRAAAIPKAQQVIGVDGLTFYANWQGSGAFRIGNAGISPIPWIYVGSYEKGILDR
jgi:hypothetical protein